MSHLFTPLQIKDITFRNRIAISPMCQYSANDGFLNDYHLVHLGARAIGGAGLIIQEATGVSPEGRITPGDAGIWDDAHLENLSRITRFIRSFGSVPGIQIAHAGRKASCARPWEGGHQLLEANGGWQTVSASALPFNENEVPPAELDLPGIRKVINDFRTAAARARQAGYQVLEIHAAHGYLIHQFLSPLSNRRTDEYGGTYENRTRLIREITSQTRAVWPDNLPLFVRLSCTDYVEGGWNVDETIQLSALLKNLGADLIDCSSGGAVPYAKIPFGPGYQVGFAGQVRHQAGVMTGAVGLITAAKQAEEILANGHADLILIGRQSLRDPNFPLHAAKELGVDMEWPNQYLRAKA
jgi:2,4-dienoyl-CoA reductase-like NADH-dependent reductase (Old Yellow Enzyme family)